MSSFKPHLGKTTGTNLVTPPNKRCSRGFARPLRATVPVLAALIAAPLMVACGDGGFRPLHASIGGNTPASEKLARMQIAPIPGRVGQQIRNELIFQTTGGGQAKPPAYRVDIAVRERVTSTLVQRSGDARSQVYNLDAKFKVTRISDKKVLLTGTSYGRAGFERFNSIFSNVRARREAEDRAAKTIATDLMARLSAFLGSAA
ncbi:MAG: LPS assembly lipoprotein LptE [Filomicrobium sp.]